MSTAPVANPERWQRIGSLAALSMALGYLETLIPLPIPGAKLGLANIPVLVALARGDAAGALAIACIKALANGLLFGNPLMLAYSAAGTALSLLCMLPLSRLRGLRLELLSVVGATGHAMGQLLVAQAVLGSSLVWYSAPPLILVSWVTGWLCGWIAERACELVEEADGPEETDGPVEIAAEAMAKEGVSALSRRRGSFDFGGFAACAQDDTGASGGPLATSAQDDTGSDGGPLAASARDDAGGQSSFLLFLVWLAFAVLVMRVMRFELLAAFALCACAACLLARVEPKRIARSIAASAPILLVTFLAQLLTLPPAQAFTEALRMTLRLTALSASSVALMAIVSTAGLSQLVAKTSAGLERAGIPAAGPLLALETALAQAPALVARMQSGERPKALAAWKDLLPQLIADAYSGKPYASSSSTVTKR